MNKLDTEFLLKNHRDRWLSLTWVDIDLETSFYFLIIFSNRKPWSFHRTAGHNLLLWALNRQWARLVFINEKYCPVAQREIAWWMPSGRDRMWLQLQPLLLLLYSLIKGISIYTVIQAGTVSLFSSLEWVTEPYSFEVLGESPLIMYCRYLSLN